MATVTDEQRWALAVEMDGSPRVERRCQQSVPHTQFCHEPVDFACDRCGKLVCRGHMRPARMPRQIDRAAGRVLRPMFRDDAPELCTTCRRCEESLGVAIEEISEDERTAWLRGDAASGYLSTERAEVFH